MSTTKMDERGLGKRLDESLDSGEGIKERIKDRATKLVEDGEEVIENAGNKMRGQVQDHPLASILMAGGVGLLVGLLLARKR